MVCLLAAAKPREASYFSATVLGRRTASLTAGWPALPLALRVRHGAHVCNPRRARRAPASRRKQCIQACSGGGSTRGGTAAAKVRERTKAASPARGRQEAGGTGAVTTSAEAALSACAGRCGFSPTS